MNDYILIKGKYIYFGKNGYMNQIGIPTSVVLEIEKHEDFFIVSYGGVSHEFTNQELKHFVSLKKILDNYKLKNSFR